MAKPQWSQPEDRLDDRAVDQELVQVVHAAMEAADDRPENAGEHAAWIYPTQPQSSRPTIGRNTLAKVHG
jgi:hypothetical protein